MVGNVDYPISWQQRDIDAHYPGLTVLDRDLVKQKIAFPHAWHAAEMFSSFRKINSDFPEGGFTVFDQL
ncbi:hypothetical protein [Spirosoma sp. KNUC1025]|uniref:hypothetical protein n=1 Tax=Spirosoma sp. KNUC1025 TaxID=2894082 RepID=UPI003863F18F|nr:hypothetical protein LN737_26935 [Spirosoma sp. KNUC1025]